MPEYPLKLPAIRVHQPLGEFFVVTLDAATLRRITYMDATRIARVDRQFFFYSLLGSNRQSSPRRAKQIAKYINTVEAAFPNSIILAANYINDGEFQENEDNRWRVEANGNSMWHLVIPSSERMASIIDGQHRLLGFDYCDVERKSMELLCAVYMDLPHPYQAYLFATININQRKVDKSLAYEQFGYNLDDENPDSWAPDKLSVYLTRKLNLDPQSPFYRRIRVAPLNAEVLFPGSENRGWIVSTACIVEGLARLISKNPKSDRNLLHQKPMIARSRSILADDGAPFRNLYLANRDEDIYTRTSRLFGFANSILWSSARASSYIHKTIGIQGLFDVYRACINRDGLDGAEEKTGAVFEASRVVDFSDSFYQASGKGRVRIKNTLLLYGGFTTANEIAGTDSPLYGDLLRKYPKVGTGV
jgi:DNA phosphorothioation-associated DGQHR protein 1